MQSVGGRGHEHRIRGVRCNLLICILMFLTMCKIFSTVVEVIFVCFPNISKITIVKKCMHFHWVLLSVWLLVIILGRLIDDFFTSEILKCHFGFF